MRPLRMAFATALITAAVPLLVNQAQAQALAGWGWGWPRLVAAGTRTGNPYATAYGYAPTYNYATGWSYPGYGYGTGYGYPASRYAPQRHVAVAGWPTMQ